MDESEITALLGSNIIDEAARTVPMTTSETSGFCALRGPIESLSTLNMDLSLSTKSFNSANETSRTDEEKEQVVSPSQKMSTIPETIIDLTGGNKEGEGDEKVMEHSTKPMKSEGEKEEAVLLKQAIGMAKQARIIPETTIRDEITGGNKEEDDE